MTAPLARTLLVIALLVGVVGCGGKDICFNCPTPTPTPPPEGATVTGTIRKLSTVDPFNAVTVLICVDSPAGQSFDQCDNRFIDVADDSGNFERSGVDPGAERIGFFIDRNDNGLIDTGDSLAELEDPDGQLARVRDGDLVTISDVDVNFDTQTATARKITIGTPTPTPQISATPTPAPSPSPATNP